MEYDNAVLNIGSIMMNIKDKIWTGYLAEKTRSNETYEFFTVYSCIIIKCVTFDAFPHFINCFVRCLVFSCL